MSLPSSVFRFSPSEAKRTPKEPLSFGNKGSIIEISEPDTNKEYQLTIQATSTSHVNNLKYEPVEKGKASARLGKAPVDQVSDLLKKYKILL